MPIERAGNDPVLPLGARRTFRFAGVISAALLLAYGLGTSLPFFAPLLAGMLTAKPAPPPGLKGALVLMVVVLITTSIGLVLVPLLRHYSFVAWVVIALGIYLSIFVSAGLGKGPVGTLLAVGFTVIPAAGLVSHALAAAVIQAFLFGVAVAIVCQWLVYPFFPEDNIAAPDSAPAADRAQSLWLALRAIFIVLPPVFVAFSNPSLYLPIIMKSVLLAQQGSGVSARAAGHELLGSTLAAGAMALLFWFALKICPALWMFFLWMLLLGIFLGSRLYGVVRSRFAPSFWVNAFVTMLILLGPALEDTANGKDVYKAFAVRFSLFVAITIYAWMAIVALEWLRAPRHAAKAALERQ